MEQVNEAGRDWLLQCAINQAEAVRLWQDDPATPLAMATGSHFDAVVVSNRLGLETLDLISKHALPFTPALLDVRAHKVALLLPPRSERVFTTLLQNVQDPIDNLHYLAEDGFLVVPGPRPEDSSRYQWVAPPVGRPDASKLRAAAVGLAVCQAAERLDQRAIPHGSVYQSARIYPVRAVPHRATTPQTADIAWPEASQ